LKNQNFAITLLEAGFASVNQHIDKSSYSNDYKQAESLARANRLRIWEKEDTQPQEKKVVAEQKQVRLIPVVVSEIVDAGSFFIQPADDKPKLDSLMNDLNSVKHEDLPGFAPKRGLICLGKFEDDKLWYRVKVLKVESNTSNVLYVDYGNSATIPNSDLLPLPEKFEPKVIPFQAKEARFAFLDSYPNPDYADEAAEYFHTLAWGKPLFASVEYNEGDKACIRLGDFSKHQVINVQLVEAGFAVVSKVRNTDPRNSTFLALLREKQEEARAQRRGVWEFGHNIADDDE